MKEKVYKTRKTGKNKSVMKEKVYKFKVSLRGNFNGETLTGKL